jgi:ribosome-associated protein
MQNMPLIPIETPYIQLGQFLKLADIIHSGGEVKQFLFINKVMINHQIDQRRGRKLYPGDVVFVLGQTYQITSL